MADRDREQETENTEEEVDLFRKTEIRDPHDPKGGEQLSGPLGTPGPDFSMLGAGGAFPLIPSN